MGPRHLTFIPCSGYTVIHQCQSYFANLKKPNSFDLTHIERWGDSRHPLAYDLRDVGGPEGVVRLAVIEMHGGVEGSVDAQVLQVTFQHLLPVHLEHLYLCLGGVPVGTRMAVRWREVDSGSVVKG